MQQILRHPRRIYDYQPIIVVEPGAKHVEHHIFGCLTDDVRLAHAPATEQPNRALRGASQQLRHRIGRVASGHCVSRIHFISVIGMGS